MTQPKNKFEKKVRAPGKTALPTGSDTAKQNYTAITYGNDKGGIGFGVIHQPADVTSAVMLYTPDAPVSYTHLTLPTNREV